MHTNNPLKALRRKTAILSCLTALSVAGCDQFLAPKPTDVLAPENFYRSAADAVSAVNSVYSQSQWVYFWIWYESDVASDDVFATPNYGADGHQLASYTFDPTLWSIDDLWTNAYITINKANIVLDRVPPIEMDVAERNRVLGEVDLFAAPLLVHEKAIYIHEGVQHHVDRLDWEERRAYVTRTDVDYYTDADLGITLKVLEVFEEADAPPAGKRQRGEVMVAWKVTMFKKIKYHTHENVGWGSISIPEQEMHTTACWLVPPAELVNRYDRDTLDGALIGLARVARTTASLLLMCDPRDIGVLAQVQAPFTGRPTLYLYDAVPGGVGLTERLFTLTDELIGACAKLVAGCPCVDGCPSCVGPVTEVGPRGKQVAGELLAGLT